MKKVLLLVLVCVMILSSCATKNKPQAGAGPSNNEADYSSYVFESAVESQQVSTEKKPETSSTTAVVPENAVRRIIQIPAEAGSVDAEIYLPPEWEVKGTDILLDGNIHATFHSATQVGDKVAEIEKIESECADAEYIRGLEGMEGRYCLFQEEVTEGGMTFFKNEIRFFVFEGDELLELSFFPFQGLGGMGSQCDSFIEYLKTVSFI